MSQTAMKKPALNKAVLGRVLRELFHAYPVLVPLTAQIPCCVVHTSHVHLEGVSHPSRNNSLDTSISCVTLIGRETPGFRTRTFSARLDRRMTF